jgi:hypothetical protein
MQEEEEDEVEVVDRGTVVAARVRQRADDEAAPPAPSLQRRTYVCRHPRRPQS